MNKKLKWILISIFWLLLWQAISMLVGSSLLLPGPWETARGLFALLADGKFYADVTATVGRCLLAILLSLAAGFLLSILAYRNRAIRDILSLPVALFKTVPVMAVAIYMLLLLSAGNVPVLVCWVMCFPIVYTNLLTGLDNLDAEVLEMADAYEITGKRRMRFVYIPALFPYFKSAASIIAGMSWKAVVTAEVLSVPQFSLGYELMNSKYYLNTDLLFAYVAVIILISMLFEKLIVKLLKRMEPREYEGSRIIKTNKAHAEAARDVHTDDRRENADIIAPRIELRNISKSYADKKVLEDFNMVIESGKVTALMGASGIGKTTVGRLICRREEPDGGELIFSDETSISVLFQEDRLLPWLNVFDNIAIVLDNTDRVSKILSAVGLGSELSKLPSQLSGGMCRRLAIARAFAYAEDKSAGLLIADEAFRGLDDETRNSVIERVWKTGIAERTVLLITHSNELAQKLADDIVCLN